MVVIWNKKGECLLCKMRDCVHDLGKKLDEVKELDKSVKTAYRELEEAWLRFLDVIHDTESIPASW